MPDCAQRLNVLPHLFDRFAPFGAESLSYVRLDLRSQTEDESTARHRRQIPGGLRHDHRVARKGNRDRRAQRYTFGRERSVGKRQKWIVSRLGYPQAIKAKVFNRAGNARRLIKVIG